MREEHDSMRDAAQLQVVFTHGVIVENENRGAAAGEKLLQTQNLSSVAKGIARGAAVPGANQGRRRRVARDQRAQEPFS